ncbi:MAG TPA: biotin--[acetyl-CoA-carboxylase] ligase [Gammaproteobacteria bacterium]|nr:biotin--[acetyl-CoA-carboxylase] ligase [Gammaproteobacteria bacterium]
MKDYYVVDYSTLRLADGVDCSILESTTSTNDYLTKLPFSKEVKVCITREQTAGKGQYQRAWLSKKDSSVLLSLRYLFSTKVALNGLSLAVGLSVISTLEDEYQLDQLKLKWPNDIYFKDQKLAGILIENSVQNDWQSVVIGLGLNHQLGADFECDTPWTDLSKICSTLPSLVDLHEKLINGLLKSLQRFEQQGFPAFQAQWHQHDYLLGRQLELNYQDKKTVGIANGVNEQGALIIKSNNTVIEAYSSEQIRLI